MTLLAYHGDKAIKRKYVSRIEAHRRADELTQGVGWEQNGVTRGCAVGCTFDNYDHSRGPVEIGVPEHLMYLEDYIFERLPRADALKWPKQFLQAIEPGADLSLVWPRFAVWLMTDSKHGVILHVGDSADVRKAIEDVAALWQRVIGGESVASLKAEFNAARAAAYAAYAAADAADAADAAADAADAAHWKACRDKLLDLIRECPIQEPA